MYWIPFWLLSTPQFYPVYVPVPVNPATLQAPVTQQYPPPVVDRPLLVAPPGEELHIQRI